MYKVPSREEIMKQIMEMARVDYKEKIVKIKAIVNRYVRQGIAEKVVTALGVGVVREMIIDLYKNRELGRGEVERVFGVGRKTMVKLHRITGISFRTRKENNALSWKYNREKYLGISRNKNTRTKISNRMIKKWEDPEYAKRVLKSRKDNGVFFSRKYHQELLEQTLVDLRNVGLKAIPVGTKGRHIPDIIVCFGEIVAIEIERGTYKRSLEKIDVLSKLYDDVKVFRFHGNQAEVFDKNGTANLIDRKNYRELFSNASVRDVPEYTEK